MRSSGIIAIKLGAGDKLVSAGLTEKGDTISLVTKQGQSIRFKDAHLQAGTFLEYVMHTPHGPHALGEVRVEVGFRPNSDAITAQRLAVSRACKRRNRR